MTLEDAGTITLQVGSCSSEAQLKVTGGHPYPTSALPSGVLCLLALQLLQRGLDAQGF